MDNGVATIGASGKVALLVGVDVDTSVSVDTKPAQQAVVNTATTVATDTTKVAEKVAAPVQHAGNTIAKPFKKIKKPKWL
jgi:hypothetical protein